ncbi:MAG: MMPL family transporter [Pirellula sp.]
MIGRRAVFFALALVLFVAAWPASQRLTLDRSLNHMFAQDDPIRSDFESLQSKFGVSDLVVFAFRDSSLFQADGQGIERLRAIRQKIEVLPGIAHATDLSKIDQVLKQLENPLSMFGTMTIKASHPLLDERNVMASRFKLLFEGQTHSGSSDLVAIACMLRKSSSETGSQTSTISQLRRIGDSLPKEFGVSEAMLVGQPVMVEDGFEAIEQDGQRLGYLSVVSLSLLIAIGFRSIRWALITVAVVQWSLVVTRGLLSSMAWDLTMVSSMLSSIVTVIGVATTMHWMLGYQTATAMGKGPVEALTHSMRALWWPIFWACITDAIGFGSLAFAKVGPVQDYGCMMALASIVVLAGIFCLVPMLALMPWLPERYANCIGLGYKLWPIPGDVLIRGCLRRMLRLSARHPWLIVVGSILVSAIAILGSLRLEVETDFVKNFKSDSSLVVSYQAIERELGGAGVWDVVLPAPKMLSQEYLDEVIVLETKLNEIEIAGLEPLGLSQVMSLADIDRVASSSSVLARLSVEGRLLGMRQAMGNLVSTLVTDAGEDGRHLRIMLRAREQSDAEQKKQLIREVRQVVDQTVRSERWQVLLGEPRKATVSGYYVLLSELVTSVVADQWRCFAIATVGIWVAMALALRSMAWPVLAILPNAMPSFCILGFMGWTGMRVNLGAAMIAAVSMGLSVDSSLHYLFRVQSEMRAGKDWSQASQATQSETGLAMLLSTLALVIGFGSLATSDFLPTVVFGVTAALSMLGGLLGNLILLPALLSVSNHRSQR